MKFKIIYDSPGRLRVRCGQNVFSELQASGFENELSSICGVHYVKASSVNGGILVVYSGDIRGALLDRIEKTEVADIPKLPLTPLQITDKEFKKNFGKIIMKNIIMKMLVPSCLRLPFTVIRAIPFVKKGVAGILDGKINVSVLDAVSISASVISGSYGTASSVMTLLNISALLEDYTRKKAKNALGSGLSVSVESVWIVKNGNTEIMPLKDVSIGDVIRVQCGSMIPVDGTVVSGEAGVNESSMTGESLPCHKKNGLSVYAGTVIEEGELDIEVTSLPDGSRISKIVELIESSENLKSGVQTKAEAFADSLVPLSLITCAATYLFTGNITKALSVLMVDYSCAIKLSTPICVISAMREAVGHGIMVKGGRFLENFAHADTIIFGKTGTLTVSCPNLSKVVAFDGYSEDQILKIAACLEEHFPHSVARAIVYAAEKKNLRHEEEHAEVEYVVAHGISSKLNGQKVLIGSAHFIFDDEKIETTAMQKREISKLGESYSMIYLAVGGKLCGILCIEDPIRQNAVQVIQSLKNKGFSEIMMITGDGEITARNVCNELGIEKFYARVLPEDKLNIVNSVRNKSHKVVMVGDGINDSPALAAADVSVAMKDASDIAKEVADITLLRSDLNGLVVLRELSECLFKRIYSNYRFISVFNSALIVMGITGVISPIASALLHNISTMGICAGSMRPFFKDEELNAVSD